MNKKQFKYWTFRIKRIYLESSIVRLLYQNLINMLENYIYTYGHGREHDMS